MDFMDYVGYFQHYNLYKNNTEDIQIFWWLEVDYGH